MTALEAIKQATHRPTDLAMLELIEDLLQDVFACQDVNAALDLRRRLAHLREKVSAVETAALVRANDLCH